MALSIEMVESNDSPTAVPSSPAGSSSYIHEPSWEYYLRKYLMLLAGLVATATYDLVRGLVASVVVIVLLLQESLQNVVLLLYAMNTAIVLDLLGLLGAYAVGSSRGWKATGYFIALFAAVLAYIAIHLVLWFLGRRARD